jgi:hypothetical protein
MADPFVTLSPCVLTVVTGGRTTHVPQIDPALIQGIGELAKSVQVVGQTLAATKQQSDGQMMQMMQQLMQSKMARR